MVVYKFIGEGMGVPGLPHVVSMEYAKTMGVEDFLKTAIEAGLYVEQESTQETKSTKKEKEVKHG